MQPKTAYFYRAVGPDGAAAAGRFRTPAALGQRPGLRFGVSRDWSQDLAPYPAVRNIPDRDLDCFVSLGDSIYSDFPSPAVPGVADELTEFRAKYVESMSDRHGLNTWPEVRSRTALLATIDDHEVINDFGGGASPATDPRFAGQAGTWVNETRTYREALQAFHEFMPLRQETWETGREARFAGKPRLYRYRNFGSDAAFFMLDGRSFRDAALTRILNRDPWAAATFLLQAAWPGRTLLGRTQLDLLKEDLIAAERSGITWKFVFVPVPIQALGVIAASDRYEGYAAERSELLGFIQDHKFRNAVFVTADFHGALVNNLVYSWLPFTLLNHPPTWEIITGPVALEPTLGVDIVEMGEKAGIVKHDEKATYEKLDRIGKDRFVKGVVNKMVRAQGLDPLGLDGSPIQATLDTGEYEILHSFGWAEFEVAGADLTVTSYGIDSYRKVDLATDPAEIARRRPQVIGRFRVKAAQ